jgi:ABC-type transporter Mla MlaB component
MATGYRPDTQRIQGVAMSLTVIGGLSEGRLGGDALPMGWTEGRTGTVYGDQCIVLRLNGSLVCDLTGLDSVDLGLVDQMARLRLAARRAGGVVTFQHAGAALRGLLALIGLEDLLLAEQDRNSASVECQRQPEHREQPGVEKDIEVPHPPP